MRFFRQLCMVLLMASLAGFAIATPHKSHKPQETVQDTALTRPSTILELFTSQGCSSCPAANKFVRDMADTDDVLALSYSVDYWDYLGWKDTFGKPEFSARQRTYGKQFGGKVYTPQIVINGVVHGARFTAQKVGAQKLENALQIALKEDTDGLSLHVRAAPVSKKPLSIMAVRYRPGVQSVPVKRGENRGRTLMLANVVQSCKEIGRMENAFPFNKTIAAPDESEAIVILIQDGRGGPILGAANYTP